MFVKFLLPGVVFCLFICTAHAQNLKQDSTTYSHAEEQVIEYYNASVGDQSEFYNGIEYQLYPPAYKGSAYFQDIPSLVPSTILYNGKWYKDVPVLYDMYNDLMVSSLRDKLFSFRTDKISEVYLSGHHFIYLKDQNEEKLTPGFYDQLYKGKSEVLIKRIKTMQSTVTLQTDEVKYESREEIYIKRGSASIAVNSKKSVLDVFKDKSKELKQFLNSNNISYKKNKEQSIVKLASYYDELTK
jgi:hypothetical protein